MSALSDLDTFNVFLDENLEKIQSHRDKVTLLRRETGVLLVEAAGVFGPEAVVELRGFEEEGESRRRCGGSSLDGDTLLPRLEQHLDSGSSLDSRTLLPRLDGSSLLDSDTPLPRLEQHLDLALAYNLKTSDHRQIIRDIGLVELAEQEPTDSN